MRRIRKTFKRPRMPWQAEQITGERKTLRQYGLRRKRELWKVQSILRSVRRQARELNAVKDTEKAGLLIDKLVKLGLVAPNTVLDDVLSLSVADILERRLQTLIAKKGMATGAKQARQLIVHGHIAVEGQRIMSPSYIVPLNKENKIGWYREEVRTR